MTRITLATAAAAALTAGMATAETEITFWHAMGGELGETVNDVARMFNDSQDEYTLTPVFKGTYEEALTAGIAAFRAGEQPNILQVVRRRCRHRDRCQGRYDPRAGSVGSQRH